MPSIPEVFVVAVQQYDAGHVAEAEQICRQIVAADASCGSAWNFLGVIELKRHDLASATKFLQEALRLHPNFADAHNNLGLVLQEQRRFDEAESCYRRALELQPEFAEAHHNLGLTIHDRGNPADAIEHYRRAIALKPESAHPHVNLGNALKVQGDLDAAAACYRRALAAKPNFAEAVHNLGSVQLAQGDYRGALGSYEQAVRLEPDFAEAHKNLSQLRLLLEDFDGGWREYEWRWKTGELPPLQYSHPRWNGEPLAGKTILLVAEQGLGDTIQFIRYASLVASQGARVLLHCQQPLVPLVHTCPSVDELFVTDDPLPSFDYYIPLLSLPGIFKSDLRTIPAHVPYLSTDSSLVEHWKAMLAPIHGFRIGINWRGRPGNDDFCLRDIPLHELAQLATVENVQLISLQKGEGQDELRAAGDRVRVLDLGDRLDESSGAFLDTAAVMKNLDLVITSDTSIAHLAGALGVPVWIGLPFVPNWRWFLNRSDSPWYPTMRLFRQRSRCNWANVIDEMCEALANLVGR
jgi:tetratricopeptide (TPR) repeat protein